MSRSLLLIEDQEAIAIPLADRLRLEGYNVDVEQDGPSGFRAALHLPFDVIILDLMLPGKSGFEICRDLRSQHIGTPILMLTAKGRSADKVAGLKLGADDYLTKPFDLAELLARLEALLRRVPKPEPLREPELRFGDLYIDAVRAEVRRGDRKLVLAHKEFQLLRYLATHPGVVLSRDELMREVWGYGSSISTRTVDVHVGLLRQKLEDDPKNPRLIITIIGSGYKFTPEAAVAAAATA